MADHDRRRLARELEREREETQMVQEEYRALDREHCRLLWALTQQERELTELRERDGRQQGFNSGMSGVTNTNSSFASDITGLRLEAMAEVEGLREVGVTARAAQQHLFAEYQAAEHQLEREVSMRQQESEELRTALMELSRLRAECSAEERGKGNGLEPQRGSLLKQKQNDNSGVKLRPRGSVTFKEATPPSPSTPSTTANPATSGSEVTAATQQNLLSLQGEYWLQRSEAAREAELQESTAAATALQSPRVRGLSVQEAQAATRRAQILEDESRELAVALKELEQLRRCEVDVSKEVPADRSLGRFGSSEWDSACLEGECLDTDGWDGISGVVDVTDRYPGGASWQSSDLRGEMARLASELAEMRASVRTDIGRGAEAEEQAAALEVVVSMIQVQKRILRAEQSQNSKNGELLEKKLDALAQKQEVTSAELVEKLNQANKYRHKRGGAAQKAKPPAQVSNEIRNAVDGQSPQHSMRTLPADVSEALKECSGLRHKIEELVTDVTRDQKIEELRAKVEEIRGSSISPRVAAMSTSSWTAPPWAARVNMAAAQTLAGAAQWPRMQSLPVALGSQPNSARNSPMLRCVDGRMVSADLRMVSSDLYSVSSAGEPTLLHGKGSTQQLVSGWQDAVSPRARYREAQPARQVSASGSVVPQASPIPLRGKAPAQHSPRLAAVVTQSPRESLRVPHASRARMAPTRVAMAPRMARSSSDACINGRRVV